MSLDPARRAAVFGGCMVVGIVGLAALTILVDWWGRTRFPGLPVHTDGAKAAAEAKRTGKLLVEYWHDPTEAESRDFTTRVLGDRAVVALADRFVWKQFDAKYWRRRIQGRPTDDRSLPEVVIVRLAGDTVGRIDTLPGAHRLSAAEFVEALTAALAGSEEVDRARRRRAESRR